VRLFLAKPGHPWTTSHELLWRDAELLAPLPPGVLDARGMCVLDLLLAARWPAGQPLTLIYAL
jgi:hypothetical protein